MTDDEIIRFFQDSPYDGSDESALSIGHAIRNAVLEEAANVCDEISHDMWRLYKGRPPYKGDEEGRADQHTQGMSDGADNCADAIRALAASDSEGGGS